MTPDTLVFDIETQNFFTDPGVGWNNFGALKISVVGVYSYAQDRYFCFEEGEMPELAKLFVTAGRLVGFSMNRYDVPVLNLYFKKTGKEDPALDLWRKERVDLLDVIEVQTGARVSLSRLAQANLGVAKDMHGSAAIRLFAEGKMEELKEYCLNDVRLTKELYDLYRLHNSLMVPNKETGEVQKIEFPASPAAATSRHATLF